MNRCKDCKHFSPISPTTCPDKGLCKRYPPIAKKSGSKYPIVGDQWWCGEFSQKEITKTLTNSAVLKTGSLVKTTKGDYTIVNVNNGYQLKPL